MAAEYEVNIKLNTKNVEQQLKNIDARTKRTGRMATENINALVKGQDRRARLMNKINELESRGLNVAKLRKQMGKATEELAKRRFGSLQQEFRLLTRTLRLEESKLRILRQQQQGFPSSPLRGTAGMMGSPAQIAASARAGGPRSPIGGAANIAGSPAARRIRRQRFEQVGLGAGFPLLFGGGAGSVLGGGLGGLTGSFGAQIALSALGQQVDKFAASAVQTGQALNSTGGALDLMREKSLFSSAATEERAAVLEELGKVEELAALLTEELTGKIGNEGVRSLQELGKTTDETTRLWSELTTQLFALVSGPLNEFLKIVNQVLGAVTGAGRREAFFGDLGEQEKAARARFKELTGESLGTGRSGAKARAEAEAAGRVFLSQEEALKQTMKEFKVVDPVQIPVTAADRRRFDVKNTKAAREEERLQKRLGKLEEERKKVLEISRFRDKIAAAEAAEDDELVIRLQGEQQIAEIEASRLKALVGVADQREIEAINIGKATEKLAAHRDTERELAELQRQRQEKFEDTIEDLEHQLALATATSEAERERLRIEKELQELREDGMSESQLGQIGDLMRQISAENSPLNKFIKQSVESLNDLETQAVQVAQGIGNAIGNSLVNGLQNLVTGAQSVKEVVADMLKSIANVLAQQAAQMIATYIAIGVARAFAGMGGGESSAPAPDIQTGQGFGLGDQIMVGGMRTAAAGAYVGSPTTTLIGEGGEPEYVIPESKMRESMARYSRGARGSSVIPDSGASGTSGEGGGTAVAAPIDVRYTVERINSIDYVTVDQFQTGMRQAANQGAKQGEQQTLKRLQMSGSTRKRLGL